MRSTMAISVRPWRRRSWSSSRGSRSVPRPCEGGCGSTGSSILPGASGRIARGGPARRRWAPCCRWMAHTMRGSRAAAPPVSWWRTLMMRVVGSWRGSTSMRAPSLPWTASDGTCGAMAYRCVSTRTSTRRTALRGSRRWSSSWPARSLRANLSGRWQS